MFENEKIDRHSFLLIVVLIILSTSFFRFSYFFTSAETKLITIILQIILCGIIVSKINGVTASNMRFSRGLLAIFILSLCSAIPAYLIYNQRLFDSLRTCFFTMGFILPYWYLHVRAVNGKTVIYAIGFVALLLAFIQIYQQFLPEYALWGVSGNDYEDAWAILERTMRNDLYRFRIGFNGVFTMPILFLAWTQLTKKINAKYMLLFILMAVSIYLNLTRQLMFSAIVVLALSTFLIRKEQNKSSLIFIVILIGGFFLQYADSLFGDLLQNASEQANDETYVRYLSYAYFWENSYDSFFSVLFGHGLAAGNSDYAQLREMLHMNNINASDVGFVGAFFNWGYIHVMIFFYFIYKIWRNRFIIPSYLFLFFIAITLTSVMIWPLLGEASILAVALMLYLCDLNLNEYEQL